MRWTLFSVLLFTLIVSVTTSAAPIPIKANSNVHDPSRPNDESFNIQRRTLADHVIPQSSTILSSSTSSTHGHLRRQWTWTDSWFLNEIQDRIRNTALTKAFKHYVFGAQVLPNDPSRLQYQTSSGSGGTDGKGGGEGEDEERSFSSGGSRGGGGGGGVSEESVMVSEASIGDGDENGDVDISTSTSGGDSGRTSSKSGHKLPKTKPKPKPTPKPTTKPTTTTKTETKAKAQTKSAESVGKTEGGLDS
ncbi:hypothetical protein FRB96_008838 [Tulasnella sp. 330]|nr:hypothetical protein FRB96_008838 [Tulasnella sp. 330]KAG8882313.1 hypothetical protein FRB97_008421 [Tulasnella sp. 331]